MEKESSLLADVIALRDYYYQRLRASEREEIEAKDSRKLNLYQQLMMQVSDFRGVVGRLDGIIEAEQKRNADSDN